MNSLVLQMDRSFGEIKDRVQRAYRSNEILLLDRGVVAEAGIEAADAEFLCTVGVPIVEELQITFNLAEKLPTLREYLGSRYSEKWPADLRCLNSKDDFIYGICNNRGGRVLCIDLIERYDPQILVNSKVRHLIGFLAECRLFRLNEGKAPKHQLIQMVRQWMHNVDREGFKTGYWQAVLEDMETYA